MSLHNKFIGLSLAALAVCAVVIFSLVTLMFERSPAQKVPAEADTEVRRVFSRGFADDPLKLSLDEVKMTPGTRVITEENAPENKADVPEEAAAQTSRDVSEEAAAGPANPLPTDEEIEQQIKEQNEKRELAEKLIAQRDKKAAAVSRRVRSLGQALSPDKVPAQSENQSPSGSIVQKVRSGEYIFN